MPTQTFDFNGQKVTISVPPDNSVFRISGDDPATIGVRDGNTIYRTTLYRMFPEITNNPSIPPAEKLRALYSALNDRFGVNYNTLSSPPAGKSLPSLEDFQSVGIQTKLLEPDQFNLIKPSAVKPLDFTKPSYDGTPAPMAGNAAQTVGSPQELAATAAAQAARASQPPAAGGSPSTGQTPATGPQGGYQIPFRTDLPLTANRQSIINLVNNKPVSQWNDTDRANWNYATGGAPLPSGGGGGAAPGAGDSTLPPASRVGDGAPPAGGSQSLDGLSAEMQQLINGNPFLADQFKDPAKLAAFLALPSGLQGALLQYGRVAQSRIEAGQVINPDIEIDPIQTQKFLTQAKTELDPYYQEQINAFQQDLDTSFTRLQEQYQRTIERAQEPFREALAGQAEAEAQSGMAFSSARADRERRLVLNQQQQLDDALRQTTEQGQDIARTGERTLGSQILQSLTAPSLRTQTATTAGFTPGQTRVLFTPTGGQTGSLARERTTAERQRASELEQAYRQSRILNYSPL